MTVDIINKFTIIGKARHVHDGAVNMGQVNNDGTLIEGDVYDGSENMKDVHVSFTTAGTVAHVNDGAMIKGDVHGEAANVGQVDMAP